MKKYQSFDTLLLSELDVLKESGLDLKMDYFYASGQFGPLQNVLDTISLYGDEQSDFATWMEWKIDVLDSGRSLQELTSIEMQELWSFYLSNEMGHEVKTQAEILLKANGEEVATWIPLLNGTTTRSPFPYFEIQSDSEYLIYPNPAQNYVIIEYELKDLDRGEIILRDLTGKLVLNKTMLSGTSQHLVDWNQLSKGAYLIEVNINNETKWQEKLIIQ